jgi:hypothetical protein
MLELAGFEVIAWHRFDKTFQFDPWCSRMNLSEADKDKLVHYILAAPQKVKDKFRIVIKDDRIISFQGEAIVLKAMKTV